MTQLKCQTVSNRYVIPIGKDVSLDSKSLRISGENDLPKRQQEYNDRTKCPGQLPHPMTLRGNHLYQSFIGKYQSFWYVTDSNR